MKDIAQEIIILRGSRKWTQQQLADAIGTTQRTVAAWESGASVPRKAMQARIAMAFGLPEDYFLKNGFQEEGDPPLEKIESREEKVIQLMHQLSEVADQEKFFNADLEKSCRELYNRLRAGLSMEGLDKLK